MIGLNKLKRLLIRSRAPLSWLLRDRCRKAIAGGFVQERLYRDCVMAVLPIHHALARLRKINLEKLGNEDWVLFLEGADEHGELCSQRNDVFARQCDVEGRNSRLALKSSSPYDLRVPKARCGSCQSWLRKLPLACAGADRSADQSYKRSYQFLKR
jgi:DNA-binding transcriptional LysR family regulator